MVNKQTGKVNRKQNTSAQERLTKWNDKEEKSLRKEKSKKKKQKTREKFNEC